MPVVITYDLTNPIDNAHNRIQSFFERLGWENLGGSSYRYPRLGSTQPTEDWFNHVVPALMLFRTFIVNNKASLTKFTLDVQTSTGFNPASGFGTAPEKDAGKGNFILYTPNNSAFGKSNLEDWILGITSPY